MKGRTYLLALMLVVASACGGATAAGLGGGIRRAPLASNAADHWKAAVAAGDAAYAQRGDRAQLELAIQKYGEAIALKDDDWQSYEKLAHAHYLLAYGYVFFEQKPEQLLAAYQKGFEVAQRGLAALSPELEQRLAGGVDLKDAIALVGKDGVGLMYWYATNLGRWGNAQDITVILKYKDRIFNMMSRVLELDPDYFHGAPYRYFGAYYSVAPAFAGGDLDKSWKFFQDAIKAEPKYVGTYNLIAENYAPKKQDAALFDEMVKKVLDAPADIIPGLEAETAIEKRHAERLQKAKAAGEIPL